MKGGAGGGGDQFRIVTGGEEMQSLGILTQKNLSSSRRTLYSEEGGQGLESRSSEPGVVVHLCTPSAWVVEAGGLGIQGQLHRGLL